MIHRPRSTAAGAARSLTALKATLDRLLGLYSLGLMKAIRPVRPPPRSPGYRLWRGEIFTAPTPSPSALHHRIAYLVRGDYVAITASAMVFDTRSSRQPHPGTVAASAALVRLAIPPSLKMRSTAPTPASGPSRLHDPITLSAPPRATSISKVPACRSRLRHAAYAVNRPG